SVSAILGTGSPWRGSRVTLFVTIPPIPVRSIASDISLPEPKHPEAASTGVGNTRSPRSTASATSASGSTRMALIPCAPRALPRPADAEAARHHLLHRHLAGNTTRQAELRHGAEHRVRAARVDDVGRGAFDDGGHHVGDAAGLAQRPVLRGDGERIAGALALD